VLVPFAMLTLLLGARLLLHATEEPPAAEVGARQVEQAPADVWDAQAIEAGSTETAARANPSPAPAPNVFASLGLKARIVDGLPAGYVVEPSDTVVLAATPLARGDVLMQVDGELLDEALLAELLSSAQRSDVRVLIERAGQELEVTLRPPMRP
jgi:hypothetical protein